MRLTQKQIDTLVELFSGDVQGYALSIIVDGIPRFIGSDNVDMGIAMQLLGLHEVNGLEMRDEIGKMMTEMKAPAKGTA